MSQNDLAVQQYAGNTLGTVQQARKPFYGVFFNTETNVNLERFATKSNDVLPQVFISIDKPVITDGFLQLKGFFIEQSELDNYSEVYENVLSNAKNILYIFIHILILYVDCLLLCCLFFVDF